MTHSTTQIWWIPIGEAVQTHHASRPATSLVCRALCNVAKTKKYLPMEKRVYPDVTIVIHVPKSQALPPLFVWGQRSLHTFVREGEPGNEATNALHCTIAVMPYSAIECVLSTFMLLLYGFLSFCSKPVTYL